jgi:hypothetical protein
VRELLDDGADDDAAHEIAAEEFQPLRKQSKTLNPKNADKDETEAGRWVSKDIWEDSPRQTTTQALEWAASNLYVKDASVEDAPSSLSWTLLHLGRDNPTEFMRVLARTIQRADLEGANKAADGGKSVLDMISTIESIIGEIDS